jgi:hypothetical protein
MKVILRRAARLDLLEARNCYAQRHRRLAVRGPPGSLGFS